MIIQINNIKDWVSQNPGLIQVIQFFLPIIISLLSIRFIKTKRREPILILDVKCIKEYSRDKQQKIKQDNYLIADSNYFLQIRNEGDDVALNIYVESNNFKIVKYQNHQIGLQDELFIKIVEKSDDEIKNTKELNGEILKIYCETIGGVGFYFKYQVIDIRKQKIRFISKGYGKTKENKGNFRIDR
ncbi:MAG TPA: hypothetical protein VFD40_01655 [Candidatus Paceibacterota bacterium]|nr:hypothetical protein [Candidatus Paceibacterota bacterium]